jgi:hypothetical protein
MSDIFISYASEDRPTARAVAKRLEQEGWSVWWDRKIPPGQSFSKVLEEALSIARCVVVLWSKASCSSDWVHSEAAEGKQRGVLVPAFIEETSLPLEFKRIQTANLVEWQQRGPENELDQFLDSIRGILEGQVAIPQPRPTKTKPPLPANASIWLRFGRFVLFGFIVFFLSAALFKALYPHTPVGQVPIVLIILSIIAGAGLNSGWARWRRMRERKLRREE